MSQKVNSTCFYCILVVFLSCQRDKVTDKENPSHLFESIPSSQSGITFINEIPENSRMNSMVYEYFYNGGGVAIGDIDNDGLSDIYLTSNLKSNKLYKNKGDFRFEDITEKADVEGSFGWTTGATMIDINRDGWLDIYVCKSGKGKAKNRENELFINNKNGTFTESAAQYGLNFSGYSTQAAFFDLDKDGDLDMFLLNHNVIPIHTNNPETYKTKEDEYVGDKLFLNTNGKFVDISKKAGILNNPLGFGLGVSIGHLNEDSWPDIYVTNDYIEHDYLYYNNGDGTFRERVKTSVGHISNFSMGTDIADFNNDGLLDIITLDMIAEDNYGIKTSMSGMNPKAFNHAVNTGFHYQYMYNALQLNRGGEKFSEIAQISGVSSTDWSWAPLLADFDNDGLKDLFVTNGLKRDFRNNDFRNFKLKRLGIAKEKEEKMSLVIDELVKKTPKRKTANYFFKNNGDLTFTKTSKLWGITNESFSNGAAYADLDNDGDLDIIINNIDEEATLLKNNGSQNYIQFQFQGNSQNPFGIGCRVEIQTDRGIQVAENYLARGYQSSVDPIVHLGLGASDLIKSATIIWSDGKTQTFIDVKANQRLIVHYDNAKLSKDLVTEEDQTLLTDVTEAYKLFHLHMENVYDDFKKESLLPHKMSQFGPAVAIGDVTNDGLEDIYVGGAKGYSGALYIQQTDQTFDVADDDPWITDKEYEDVDAQFFDADNDGDLDLYVVSGGNEWQSGHSMYRDRLYININGKLRKSMATLPEMFSSGSCVKPFDFDKDGDLDILVGSRLFGQKYPFAGTSFLLENKNGIFTNVTNIKAEALVAIGMVTDAIWTDYNNDNLVDFIVVGEWMNISFFRNDNGKFVLDTSVLPNTSGWWNSIEGADMDNDGDMDYVVGNLGLNYKYKTSLIEPFEVYANDFDDNGSMDIVLGYYNQGNQFPLRGRECSSQQMPFIKKKFPTYASFGNANLEQVYGEDKLKKALHLKVTTFASVYLENKGNGQFTLIELPNEAQLSSINDIRIDDFDNDGLKDILLAGNLYESEVETPRNDASYGVLLKNTDSGFIALPESKSGVLIEGSVKKMIPFQQGKNKNILVARNENTLMILRKNN